MSKSEKLTSTEAARLLGVKLETLYAYVSRDLLRSQPVTGSRNRSYLRADVELLAQQRLHGRTVDSAARSALDWGLPVLDTELTLIEDGRLFYRGLDATELARRSTFERVAALLWLGAEEREAEIFGETLMPVDPLWTAVGREHREAHPSSNLLLAVQLAQHSDPDSGSTSQASTLRAGAHVARAIVAAAAGLKRRRRGSLAEVLAGAWCPQARGFESVLNAALILCADHELNVSSFTSRCIASAGAPVYEAVTGGLCALRGFRHGGHSDRVEALLREVGVTHEQRSPSRQDVRRRLSARLQRGEELPGFGHQLYPNGDPRFPAILAALQDGTHRSGAVLGVQRVAEEGHRLTGNEPTLDLALGAVASAGGLPRGTAWTLFALGRSVGWIAHALEEQQRQKLIRPRARYVGPRPD